jgi:hypothetical protein
MKNQNRHRRRRREFRRLARSLAVAAAAVGLVGLAAPQADAGLLIDLRAMTVNGQPLPAGGSSTPKLVYVSPGDQVGINAYAVVSGSNALNDEGFQNIHGVFHSSSGGLLGNLIDSKVIAPFNGPSSQNGSSVDFDNDGDLDIGGRNNVTTVEEVPAIVVARATSMQDGIILAGAQPAAEELLLASMTFTALTGEGQTLVNFLLRLNPNGTPTVSYATWREDGIGRGGVSPWDASGVVMFGVPEPSAIALVGVASFGLLARRPRLH